MTYPYERGEAERFVPSAFAEMKDPPTFWLRYGTTREKRRQRRMMDEEGLRLHDTDAIRRELLAGMEALLSEKDYAEWQPRAKQFWDASDSFAKEYEGIPAADVPKFTYEDEKPVKEVLNQIGRDWHPYRLMIADNRETNRTLPAITVSLIVERFENLDVEVMKEGKYLSLDTADEILEALSVATPKDLPKDQVAPSDELQSECLIRMYLGKDREKNSASPPPSPPTQSTTATGKESEAGTSKASATSTETQEG